jgi:hypothetical protein
VVLPLDIEDDQAVLIIKAVRHNVADALAAAGLGVEQDVGFGGHADIAGEQAEQKPLRAA